MAYGLYVSAEGAHAQIKRLEVLSNNLANTDTVGFKRDLAVCQARYAEAIQEGKATAGSGSLDDLGGGIMIRETATDFSPGPFRRTGTWSDVAIKGNGFFAVRKDNQTYLTRAGNFILSPKGELVTQQGHPVLSESGIPILVNQEDGTPTITPDGQVRQRSTSQMMAILMPQSLGDLAKVGENLYQPLAPPRPLAADKRELASGYLETSDVKPTTEMVDMITASRAIEANVKMMQVRDEMLGSLFGRLMRAS